MMRRDGRSRAREEWNSTPLVERKDYSVWWEGQNMGPWTAHESGDDANQYSRSSTWPQSYLIAVKIQRYAWKARRWMSLLPFSSFKPKAYGTSHSTHRGTALNHETDKEHHP